MTPSVPAWTWGDRLRKVRRDVAQLSQKDMAELIGVPTQTLGTWEADRATPAPALMRAVAAAIAAHYPSQVTQEWLLESCPDQRLCRSLPRMDSNHQPSDYRPKCVAPQRGWLPLHPPCQ